ncbi:MAG: PF20097 family protein [Planctomycetaceae bacterium]
MSLLRRPDAGGSDRRRLTWLPFDRLLFLGLFAIEGGKVGKSGLLSRPRAAGHRCPRCRTIIVDR